MATHLQFMRDIDQMTGPELLVHCDVVTADLRNLKNALEETRKVENDTEQLIRANAGIAECTQLIGVFDNLRNDVVADFAHDFKGSV
jgi:hypothetical protein